jgi:hypothetical protein
MRVTVGIYLAAFAGCILPSKALAPPSTPKATATPTSRRTALGWLVGSGSVVAAGFGSALLLPGVSQASVDTEDFIRTGMVSMPMGVSGQAGKAKPITGIIFRDGTEVSRDAKSGDVLAEILVKNVKSNNSDDDKLLAVVTTFSSPWPLAKGNVFDIECRDGETGDAAFVAVTPNVDGTALADLKDSFFTKSIFSSTGRFSLYGQPTDIKVKTVAMNGNYRMLDVSFSTLSQSTMTEIPRKAKVVATIPTGSSQAVMLIASASALRWKKGADKTIVALAESFKATPAPQTGLKVRAREAPSSL